MHANPFLDHYHQATFLERHSHLLMTSYHHWTGEQLIAHHKLTDSKDAVQSLLDTPFAIASHQAGEDPMFNYANHQALALFKMLPEDMLGLPSRYSAEPMLREARAEFLYQVSTHGFIENYSGVRIAKDGTRFLIEEATVWNVVDVALPKQVLGQGVIIKAWHAI
ncbi:MAG: MEKHLA domain-containing protein [Burkholderiaceae bacterium]|nr:MEKHLA domain-containing protein [Burkholderiaceae bacterium]